MERVKSKTMEQKEKQENEGKEGKTKYNLIK